MDDAAKFVAAVIASLVSMIVVYWKSRGGKDEGRKPNDTIEYLLESNIQLRKEKHELAERLGACLEDVASAREDAKDQRAINKRMARSGDMVGAEVPDEIRDVLSTKYSKDELALLCADLDIDIESLGDPNMPKENLVVKLISYVERHNMSKQLLTLVKEQRP